MGGVGQGMSAAIPRCGVPNCKSRISGPSSVMLREEAAYGDEVLDGWTVAVLPIVSHEETSLGEADRVKLRKGVSSDVRLDYSPKRSLTPLASSGI